jgi:hypothetical protein
MVPEQHDVPVPPGANWRQKFVANRRSLQLTTLIIVLFLIDFFWSVRTQSLAEDHARQATAAAVAHANAQWCTLINAINEGSKHSPPPTTQYGKAINAALQELYVRLGCTK